MQILPRLATMFATLNLSVSHSHPGKRTTMENNIQYLRELAVLEVIYGDLDDEQLSNIQMKCTRPMWWKFVRSTPASCANSLAILNWKDGEGPTVDEAASQIQEYEESLSSSLVLAVEKLSRKVQRLEEDSISAIRSQRSSAQGRGYRGYTPQGTLWFYLCDHGEDMRKWDGKPTSTLEARVREVQGKTITQGGSSRKIAALVSSGQFPRQSKRADLTPDFNEGAPDSYVEERDNWVYWTVCVRWPGTSDPQEYKALVDTGARCTLKPSSYTGAEPICICGVTGGSQQLTVLEAKVSLTGNEWQKHPIVTGPKAPCILGIDYLRRGYFKDPKGYRWAFGIAALEMEEIKQLSTLPGLSEDPSVVRMLRVKEQQVPIATTTVHRRQHRTNRDSLIPIHELIRRLESQGVIGKTRPPFNSPIWPVRKSNGEWRLTVDYRGLNEVMPPLSAAIPDMLELQYELESKAAKWYATTDIANAFFSIPLAAECRPHTLGIDCPRGGNSPTICHALIQTALEQGEAPEHLQYIDDIIVWGNTAAEVSEKGKKIVQILLKAGSAIKQSKVKGTAQETQFLGIKWQDGRRQIPMDVINKITAMSPPTSKNETQAFLGIVGFCRMHIPNYSLIIHLSHFNLSSLIHLLVVLMFLSGPTLGYLENSRPHILCIPDSKTLGVNLESPLVLSARGSSSVPATVCFHLEAHPIHLELTAPGLETQPCLIKTFTYFAMAPSLLIQPLSTLLSQRKIEMWTRLYTALTSNYLSSAETPEEKYQAI
ncbi:LOW QUALITY PROTEIN: hypothetical protein QYF61_004233, partial [Mycteria americana]